jgi:uncharacterized SAM-binding protein YcdF (DUF218 family)
MTNPENNRVRNETGSNVQSVKNDCRWARRIGSSFMGTVLIASVAFLGGFLIFATGIPREEVPPRRSADGIVALTGGAYRISDAVELLAAHHGRRLFISGVNPTTTIAELTRLKPEFESSFVCCVDLGRTALNTTGNAMEIAQWTRDQKFQTLIVVTSAWHMPRALVELKREMPDIELTPYSVVSDRMRDEPWWLNLQTARLLMLEYVKYLAAYARFRIDATEAGANFSDSPDKPRS